MLTGRSIVREERCDASCVEKWTDIFQWKRPITGSPFQKDTTCPCENVRRTASASPRDIKPRRCNTSVRFTVQAKRKISKSLPIELVFARCASVYRAFHRIGARVSVTLLVSVSTATTRILSLISFRFVSFRLMPATVNTAEGRSDGNPRFSKDKRIEINFSTGFYPTEF